MHTCWMGLSDNFSDYESNKAGVCILFNNNFICKSENLPLTLLDFFFIKDIKADEKNLLNLFKQLNDFTCEDIIGGDFNMVPDLEKDKFGGIPKTCQNCVKIIQEFSEKLDLVEVWKTLHPETKGYTWRSNNFCPQLLHYDISSIAAALRAWINSKGANDSRSKVFHWGCLITDL